MKNSYHDRMEEISAMVRYLFSYVHYEDSRDVPFIEAGSRAGITGERDIYFYCKR